MRLKRSSISATAVALGALACVAPIMHAMGAETVSRPTLTLEGAKRAAAAAVAYAKSHGAPGAAIAIVDAGGHTLYLERLDGTFPAGSDISIGKARTAVVFRRPTRGIEETINKGRAAMLDIAAVTWFTPLQGGVPIAMDGEIVGGIGVSGAASAQQDDEIAIAGAGAFTPAKSSAVPSSGAGTDSGVALRRLAAADSTRVTVRHIKSADVEAAFQRGETGDTLEAQPEFRVNASRRDGPGEAEVHKTETDIFYILEGAATVIAGGEVLAPREVAPGEIRGTAIRGGASYEISRGDVLTIPRGVPHWFKTVKTPFRYYVIKSVAASTARM